MNWLSLEQLNKQIAINKVKHWLKWFFWEIFRFLIVFSVVFVIGVIFINYNVFVAAFQEKILWNQASEIYKESFKLTNLKTSVLNATSSDNFENLKMQDFLNNLDSKLSKSSSTKEKEIYQRSMDKFLKSQVNKYNFTFNFLPPKSRLLIPEIWVDAPVVEVLYATPEKLEKADFDEELYKWVVKYPYSPEPWFSGNVLIFWHTSYYWWKKNPYWDIFSKLPKLKVWDSIKVIWEWKEYEYEIVEMAVKTPKKVPEIFDKYSTWKHLILMWCYPIGTDANRMLVIANQITK